MAVLFDLDGLLADTEPLHCLAYQRVMARHGVVLEAEHYFEFWTRRGWGIGEFVRARELSISADVLRQEKAIEYIELVRSVCKPMPGALELLERLNGRTTLALASAAWGDAVEAVVEKLQIRGYFSRIVSGSQVKRAKPFPDVFLEAARQLEVAPETCLVIEDAEKGVLAAKAAGMRVFAVPNDQTRGHDFSRADRVYSSLEQISTEEILGMQG